MLTLYFQCFFFRDIREYKSRVESYSREMLRKEAQIRDMTQRLENGDGSKSILFFNEKFIIIMMITRADAASANN